MPIYAFACDACGHEFDRLQKLSDPDPSACPACAAAALRRKLTAPAFRLAGSGWYETDFKKDGDKKRNLADGGDAGKAGNGEGAADKGKSEPGKSQAGKSEPAPAPATGTTAESASKPATAVPPAT